MAFSSIYQDVLFLLVVIILWLMIFYQLFFSFLGFAFHRRSLSKLESLGIIDERRFPAVTVLVPAHNEERVIASTLEALTGLDYPHAALEIIVVNDGSTDNTAGIVSGLAQRDRRIILFNIPQADAARGKAHALNLGMLQASHEFIAVYDADNTPDPAALRLLMSHFVLETGLAAVFGKFRTRNRKRNLLTSFINLETLSFQMIIQAGRYMAMEMALLPGTNFVIKKSILLEYSGWDEKALTEDSELSIRLLQNGERIKFVPYALTWEQEPEEWSVWIRQRTRWVRGNMYIMRKHLFSALRKKKPVLILELLNIFFLYYLFLGSILLSHLFFIGSSLGLIAVQIQGPYLLVWICAFLLFLFEIMLVAFLEKEASLRNLGVACLMYFSYCQGWIIVVFRAIFQELFRKNNIFWEKTPRFPDNQQNLADDKGDRETSGSDS